jgi:3-hydroxyacyl-[acyl-carrier-protein] dehydratase
MPGPVFPISLLVEALAEVGAVLALNSDENRGKIIFLAGIEGWRTHRPIEPGAELHMEAKLVARRHTYGKGHVLATQNGNPVAEGDLMFMLRADTQEGTAEQAMAVGA